MTSSVHVRPHRDIPLSTHISVSRAPLNERRACVDTLSSAAAKEVRVGVETLWGHDSQGGSRNYLHTVAHPNPMLAIMAHYMPQVVDVHAQVLRSKPEHLRLNGQNLKRTDPFALPASSSAADHATAGAPLPHSAEPRSTNWHIDNAWLAEHENTSPRQVYSRAMVTLNSVSSGGAAIMVARQSAAAAREVIDRRVRDEGQDAYLLDPLKWRSEVAQTLRSQLQAPNPAFDKASEVVSGEGDMIIFDVSTRTPTHALLATPCFLLSHQNGIENDVDGQGTRCTHHRCRSTATRAIHTVRCLYVYL